MPAQPLPSRSRRCREESKRLQNTCPFSVTTAGWNQKGCRTPAISGSPEQGGIKQATPAILGKKPKGYIPLAVLGSQREEEPRRLHNQ